jgi:hypothetical protein
MWVTVQVVGRPCEGLDQTDPGIGGAQGILGDGESTIDFPLSLFLVLLRLERRKKRLGPNCEVHSNAQDSTNLATVL